MPLHPLPRRRMLAAAGALPLALGLPGKARAGEVTVAVASNVAVPMRAIAQAFERLSGHRAVLSFGATGGFYAQVRHGAPFHLLLAADQATPQRLEREGLAVAGSRFTYAIGRLVLWSAQPGLVDPHGEVLRTGTFARLAIANPKLAPYGAAAVEAMTRLGVWERLLPRLVQGENIAQAHQFVASGNAALGFVAASQVMADGQTAVGSRWPVPAALHAPIRQDAVLLAAGRGVPAAQALQAFLRSEPARAILRAHGYTHDPAAGSAAGPAPETAPGPRAIPADPGRAPSRGTMAPPS